MIKTKLYDVHEKLGSKLVEFAGFKMPLFYSSIIKEHSAVRESVGVFDVSHMGEIILKGNNVLDFVQYLTTNNAAKLSVGKVQYSTMCNNNGGIIDDLLVYKLSDDEYMFVVNASNIQKDYDWIIKNNKFGVNVINASDDYSLIAVQGPDSQKVFGKVCDKSLDLDYYNFTFSECLNIPVIVSRTGYTGEIGYEIYLKGDSTEVELIWDTIMDIGSEYNIQPTGLGARDTLRLEMGYCLYGNDIDETINPLEAGLGWITKLKKGDFIGRDAILEVKNNGVKKRLVPIVLDTKAFPRNGYKIFLDNKEIGYVTSGVISPTLNVPIALGYVDSSCSEEGQKIFISIRNNKVPATISNLPFIGK
ncbi:glycine cleavage system aminomethyltransferase GcvT [Bacteroidota bacterium]